MEFPARADDDPRAFQAELDPSLSVPDAFHAVSEIAVPRIMPLDRMVCMPAPELAKLVPRMVALVASMPTESGDGQLPHVPIDEHETAKALAEDIDNLRRGVIPEGTHLHPQQAASGRGTVSPGRVVLQLSDLSSPSPAVATTADSAGPGCQAPLWSTRSRGAAGRIYLLFSEGLPTTSQAMPASDRASLMELLETAAAGGRCGCFACAPQGSNGMAAPRQPSRCRSCLGPSAGSSVKLLFDWSTPEGCAAGVRALFSQFDAVRLAAAQVATGWGSSHVASGLTVSIAPHLENGGMDR